MAFTLLVKQVRHFEDREDLEHYVKAHMELDYDDKAELLKNGTLLIKNPEDENEYTAISIADDDVRTNNGVKGQDKE